MSRDSAGSASVLEANELSIVLGGKPVLNVPSLQVMPGEVLVVIGPNGSGKTTLLLSLAFLLKPAAGTVRFREQDVSNGLSILDVRRRFAVVFQEPLLLSASVWDNVTLGLRLRGVKREEIRPRAEKWLERFGISSLARRQARTLSGGEAKRASLARAFVLEPEVLFLDEPFNALDGPTRQALMEDFESVLRETRVTTIMVTHDRNEAMVLASRVAVMMDGRIRQMGSPQDVFASPVDEEVASFVGAGNVLHGEVASQEGGLGAVRVESRMLYAVSPLKPGTKVTLYLPHEDITLSVPTTNVVPSSARNQVPGRIVRIIPLGAQVRVSLDCGFPLVVLITARSAQEMGLAPGQVVTASFKASSVRVIPRG